MDGIPLGIINLPALLLRPRHQGTRRIPPVPETPETVSPPQTSTSLPVHVLVCQRLAEGAPVLLLAAHALLPPVVVQTSWLLTTAHHYLYPESVRGGRIEASERQVSPDCLI